MTQLSSRVEPGCLLPFILAAAAATLLGAACSPRDGTYRPGLSDGPLPSPSASSLSTSSTTNWEHFDRVGQLELLLPKHPSHGHGTGAWDAELRGSSGAGDALDRLVPGAYLAEGTLLVQHHTQRHTGADLGFFVMEKQHPGYFPDGGDWDYAVVGRDGRVEARGKLTTCARCHAEAPIDHVFPRVREAPPTKDD